MLQMGSAANRERMAQDSAVMGEWKTRDDAERETQRASQEKRKKQISPERGKNSLLRRGITFSLHTSKKLSRGRRSPKLIEEDINGKEYTSFDVSTLSQPI